MKGEAFRHFGIWSFDSGKGGEVGRRSAAAEDVGSGRGE